ncbi:hypothetical protein EDD11_002841 [Mortierella claussenii]|nr:hypothetical protein EDD11_002841 [Mortierella claussenii]
MASEPHSSLSTAPSARLSYHDFELAIKAFLKQAKHHSPWSYVEYRPRRGQPLQGYLAMTQLKHSHQSLQQELSKTATATTTTTAPTATTGGVSENASEQGDADQILLNDLVEHFGDIPDAEHDDMDALADTLVNTSMSSHSVSQDFLSVSYHIVFSPSYQVPVLYFNACRPDGRTIPLEEIYDSLVPEEWRGSIRNAGLNGGISQQDHPVLNVPYFYMHPCETVALMETILKSPHHHQSLGGGDGDGK